MALDSKEAGIGAATGAGLGFATGGPIGAVVGGLFGWLNNAFGGDDEDDMADPIPVDPSKWESGTTKYNDTGKKDANGNPIYGKVAGSQYGAPDYYKDKHVVEQPGVKAIQTARGWGADTRNQQQQALGDLKRRASGDLSISRLMGKEMADRNRAAAASAAASVPGGYDPAAQRAAQYNMASAGQDIAGKVATAAGKESAAAQSALQNSLYGMRGQDMTQQGMEQSRFNDLGNWFLNQNKLKFNWSAQGLQDKESERAAQVDYMKTLINQNQGQQQLAAGKTAAQYGLLGDGIRTLGQVGTALATSDIRAKKDFGPGGGETDKFLGALSNLGIDEPGMRSTIGGKLSDSDLSMLSKLTPQQPQQDAGADFQQTGKLPPGILKMLTSGEKMSDGDRSQADQFMGALNPSTYRYKDPSSPLTGPGEHLGVMAQDLEKTVAGQQMVKQAPDGTKMVDYNEGGPAILAGLARLNERLDKVEGKKPKKKSTPKETTTPLRRPAFAGGEQDGRVVQPPNNRLAIMKGGASLPGSDPETLGWMQYQPSVSPAVAASPYPVHPPPMPPSALAAGGVQVPPPLPQQPAPGGYDPSAMAGSLPGWLQMMGNR
jgi:hypothetical protein